MAALLVVVAAVSTASAADSAPALTTTSRTLGTSREYGGLAEFAVVLALIWIAWINGSL
jgi:hypothetical protein